MPFRDLREFLSSLDSAGDLRRIKAEVDRDLEISEITDRTTKSAGPALLFENVRGFKIPVAMNVFGTPARMARALDVPDVDALTEKMNVLVRLATEPPTGGWLDKLKVLPKLLGLSQAMPRIVSGGPCKEVIHTADASLDVLPVLKCWPQDAGRFITFPLVFTKDPETGRRNVGTYRMQVFDGRTTGMHWHPHKDGTRHYRKACEKKERLPVAVAIGPDPAVAFAGTVPFPPDMDELLLAGYLRGEPVDLVRCETSALEVPATAEIVLEGYVEPGESRLEGPFGDHNGHYSVPGEFPVFHLTALTHRRDPIYQSIIVGPPPQEDGAMGLAIERLFLPLMRLTLPEIVDYHMPVEGVFHNLVIVSIRKSYPGHARKVMHGIWGLGQAMFSKVIVIVDHDVNVHDPREVTWLALSSIDPERDMEIAHGPMDILDHATPAPIYGSKIGIDATRKWPGDPGTRTWPDVIRMTPEVRAVVDKKWKELGIDRPR